MKRRGVTAREIVADYPFYTLAALLIAAVLFGGSGRDDAMSLILLRPLSAGALAIALVGVTRPLVQRYRMPLSFMAAIVVLSLLHLIPLPPSVWTALPGRELAANVATAAGLEQPWRPLAMVPWRGWNALFSLMVPCAALLLTLQCTAEQRRRTLNLIIVLGLLSAVWAIVQAVSGFGRGWYLYAVTNVGSPTGLFANRNHQAVFLACLLPLLAYAAARGADRGALVLRRWGAAALGIVLLFLLLATGSRAGAGAAFVALLSVALIYRPTDVDGSGGRRLVWAGLAGVGLLLVIVVAVAYSRADTVDRILQTGVSDDRRFESWGPIAGMIGTYFPFGSGVGSFVEVFKVAETKDLLALTYLNHAHNDWLEWALDGGLPAILLMIVAVAGWARSFATAIRGFLARQEGAQLAVVGGVLMLLLGLASIVDYPLRTPALASVMAVAAAWLAAGTTRGDSAERSERIVAGEQAPAFRPKEG